MRFDIYCCVLVGSTTEDLFIQGRLDARISSEISSEKWIIHTIITAQKMKKSVIEKFIFGVVITDNLELHYDISWIMVY